MSEGGKEQGYWFKAKKYGWGWGLPLNLKGWLSFGLFFAIWLVALLWLVSTGESTDNLSRNNILLFGVIFLADTMAFTFVSFKYGEPPKWRWGSKKRAAKSKSD